MSPTTGAWEGEDWSSAVGDLKGLLARAKVVVSTAICVQLCVVIVQRITQGVEK